MGAVKHGQAIFSNSETIARGPLSQAPGGQRRTEKNRLGGQRFLESYLVFLYVQEDLILGKIVKTVIKFDAFAK